MDSREWKKDNTTGNLTLNDHQTVFINTVRTERRTDNQQRIIVESRL